MSRKTHVSGENSGSWGSSSQDFARLAYLLYGHSADYAKAHGGNISIYAIAGIPMLFSALRCLLIELNAGMHTATRRQQEVLEELASSSRDIDVVINHYHPPGELKTELISLWEVRNEIVHPAHLHGPEIGTTPQYLLGLREHGLLNSTDQESDYVWIEQLKSHRLFQWAFSTIRDTVAILLAHHDVKVTDPMRPTLIDAYSKFEQIDRDI